MRPSLRPSCSGVPACAPHAVRERPLGPRNAPPHVAGRLARLAISCAVALLAGCGDGPARTPEPGPYVAQEIWITYFSPAHEGMGRRTGRSREEARALADDLHRRVRAGEDLGRLAVKHSNAPGAAAFGFSGWRGEDRRVWDVRDETLVRTAIGEVTEVVDWLGGWWFARRVPPERGRSLEREFHRLHRLRARIRAIAVVYRGAAGLGADDLVLRTREEARARAEEALAAARAGIDFADVARRYSDDVASRERGGLVQVPGPDRAPTEWLRVGEEWIVQGVLEAAFEGEVGKVWPRVVESERGYFVVKVEERVERAGP